MEKILKQNIHWLLRIMIASTFVIHGYPKLGQTVADLGYIGYLVGPFEFIGAIMLLVGPFLVSNVTRVGSLMLSVIMMGAIYYHLFKWGDTLGDVEWQCLLLSVSLYFLVKGNND